jgi:hypothetical protein
MQSEKPKPKSAKLAERRAMWAEHVAAEREAEIAGSGALGVMVMDAEEARLLTDEIKRDAEVLWDKIVTVYTQRAWAALGYATWDEYVIRELGSTRLRLPREERTEIVTSLRHAGLSMRAIASATGLGRGTVQREIEAGEENSTPEPVDAEAESTVPNGTPEPIDAEIVDEPVATVTGIDGKRHPAKKPVKNKPESQPVVDPDPDEAHRFWDLRDRDIWDRGSYVERYVDSIADIALSSETDIDTETPLTAGDLPEILGRDNTYGATEYNDARVAIELADKLAAALPRIEELRDLLYERGRTAGSGDRP